MDYVKALIPRKSEGGSITLPLDEYIGISEGVIQANERADRAEQANSALATELTQAITDRNNALEQALSANEHAQNVAAELTQAKIEIDRLTTALAEATGTKPPEPTPDPVPQPDPTPQPGPTPNPEPVDPYAPILTKQTLRFIGARIVKDETPGDAQNTLVRANLVRCAQIGINVWAGLLNLQEVEDHLKALENGDRVNNLVTYGADRGMWFAADTIDSQVYDHDKKLFRSDTVLKPYFDGHVKLGTKLLIINDAQQYRETKNPDGSLKFPPGTLEKIVGIIRRLCPSLPLMASLSVSRNPDDYAMFDFQEAQTFGRVDLMDDFLAKPGFDVFCLPARLKETAAYHVAVRPAILEALPDAVFFHAALERGGTNWTEMKEATIEIASTIRQMREKRAERAK